MVMTPYFPHPDLLIYLKALLMILLLESKNVDVAMEQQTPIDYWEEMHNRYENWIDNFNACPVLRLILMIMILWQMKNQLSHY